MTFEEDIRKWAALDTKLLTLTLLLKVLGTKKMKLNNPY